MDDGAFDDLPYQGERLPLEDDSAAGEWAMAHRMLRNAGAAPPWIESDKEARRQLAALEALVERAPRMSRLSHRPARAELGSIVAPPTGRSSESMPRRRRTGNIGVRWTPRPRLPVWSELSAANVSGERVPRPMRARP